MSWWVRDLRLRPLSKRLAETFRLQAVNIAHHDSAYAAYKLLRVLQLELSISGHEYDLSDTASFIAKCLFTWNGPPLDLA